MAPALAWSTQAYSVLSCGEASAAQLAELVKAEAQLDVTSIEGGRERGR